MFEAFSGLSCLNLPNDECCFCWSTGFCLGMLEAFLVIMFTESWTYSYRWPVIPRCCGWTWDLPLKCVCVVSTTSCCPSGVLEWQPGVTYCCRANCFDNTAGSQKLFLERYLWSLDHSSAHNWISNSINLLQLLSILLCFAILIFLIYMHSVNYYFHRSD